ncbi:hypothetical protein SELR_12910 [Selenomonas ruminantium subsp. lactilytica TAM6421]|uniref:Uncharacterized protein n=1 Tax=Selenomonas ruminantium subsp. lactilytica (strain NBRC 103574 / TAM6421) TaxID=927704 RepID=I0GQG2_SELRL|nr:hypothetical protein [Selenomonas ruminantium]BAL82999.1 hypothetical protein SELR_12910 [Selenomonas ruminantium subsp. lactilytica TAM6421]
MLTRAVKITFDVRNPEKAKYELEMVDSSMLTQAKDFSDEELQGAVDYYIEHAENEITRAQAIRAKALLPRYLALRKAGVI